MENAGGSRRMINDGDPSQASARTAVPDPPLVLAAQKSDESALRRLLEAGADPNAKDSDGWVALHFTSARNWLEGSAMLLTAGANPDELTGDGSTALTNASSKASVEVIELLLEAGADVNARSAQTGYEPVQSASGGGNAPVAKLLLAWGANPNSADIDGYTALMAAAESGDEDTVKLLLAAWADKDVTFDTAGGWRLALWWPVNSLNDWDTQ